MIKQRHQVSQNFAHYDAFPSGHGFIKIDRDFFQLWPLAKDDACCKTFLYLMTEAVFKDFMVGTFVVHRGCLLTTYDRIANDLFKTREQVKYIIKRIKEIGDIETKKVKNFLLIRLPNYNKYQGSGHSDKDSFPLPLPYTSTEIAQALPINKEKKNEENVYNENNFNKYTEPVDNFKGGGLKPIGEIVARQGMLAIQPPKYSEIEDYCERHGLKFDLDAFYAYYNRNKWLGKDKKPLDWPAAAKRWHKRATEQEMAEIEEECS